MSPTVDDPAVESGPRTVETTGPPATDPSAGPFVAALWRSRVHLWLVAVAFFAVGDVATTAVGLASGRVAEAGPIVGPVIARHGVAALVALKAGTFGCCYLLSRFVPRPHGVGVPLAMAALGVFVTGWNLAVLAVAGVL